MILFILFSFFISLQLSIKNGIYVYKNFKIDQIIYTKKDLYEGFFIIPCNPFLLFLALQIMKCYKINEYELRPYITFLRVSSNPILKLYCDWCSVANGFLHYIEEKKPTVQHPNYLQLCLYVTKMYIKLSQCMRPQTNRIQMTNNHFIDLVKLVHNTEKRYCPFNSIKNRTYRRHEYYIDDENIDIAKIGKHLRKFPTIECYKCSEECNQILEQSNTEPSKYYEDLMEEFLIFSINNN